jgi:hypothetical protein
MRHMDPDRHRPFLIPGGEVFAKLITWTCAGILGLSMVLFCYTPGEGMQWPVFVGAVVITACGELVIRITEARRPALSPA